MIGSDSPQPDRTPRQTGHHARADTTPEPTPRQSERTTAVEPPASIRGRSLVLHRRRAELTSAIETLVCQVRQTWPPQRWRNTHVLVGVSGGADSVALLRVLAHQSRHMAETDRPHGRLIAAHLNHGLRGAASDGDQAMVRDLCDSLEIDLVVDRLDDPPRDENALRDLRHGFLRRTATRWGARYVAVGHHADDNVESVLMNLFRGTGMAGLAGMSVHRDFGDDLVLVRPLLRCNRTEIEAYLNAIGQSFRQDESNSDVRHRRNFIRHELLPLVRSRFPDADAAIRTAIQHHDEATRGLKTIADRHLSKLAEFRLDPDSRWRKLDTLTTAPSDDALDRVELRFWVEPDSDLEPTVAAIALQRAFDRVRYSRRNMDHDHWRRLAGMWLGLRTDSHCIPGNRWALVDGETSNSIEHAKQGGSTSNTYLYLRPQPPRRHR